MDLNEILRKRVESDLAVAAARSLELSLEIEVVAAELKVLRAEWSEVEGRQIPVGSQQEMAGAGAVSSAALSTDEVPTRSEMQMLYRRFFRKFISRPAPKPQFHWHLDEIAGVFPARGKGGVDVHLSSTSFPAVTMSGWIVPMGDEPAFAAIEMTLSGPRGAISREVRTYHRPDVGAHFGNPDLTTCGFRLEFPMFEVPVGQYAVKISGRKSDGSTMSAPVGSITIS